MQKTDCDCGRTGGGLSGVVLAVAVAPHEHPEQMLLISGFKGLQPDRAMIRFGEIIHPCDQRQPDLRSAIEQRGRHDVQCLGERALSCGRPQAASDRSLNGAKSLCNRSANADQPFLPF